MTSCIYSGYVRHRRHRPRVHAFRYRLFQLHLDLDELPEVDRAVRLFSVNRFNAVALHERDHLDRRPGDLRPRLAEVLRDAGVSLPAPKIYLLTQCRILGYVFNPISVFYCHDGPGGPLRAVVAEVNNTFGERHLYVLRDPLNPGSAGSRQAVRFRAAKQLYVSPFLPTDGYYDFHFAPVGARLSIGILHYDRGRPTLDAQFWGRRVALTTRSLAGLLATHPLAAVGTIAAIHGEALRLWWKRIPVYRRDPRGSRGPASRASVDGGARVVARTPVERTAAAPTPVERTAAGSIPAVATPEDEGHAS